MSRMIDAHIEAMPDHSPGVVVSWADLEDGDVGSWVTYPQYPKKTLSVDGGDVRIEGQNAPEVRGREPLAESGWALTDDADGATITGPGLYVLQENPLRLRPRVVRGESVTVRLVATR